MRHVENLLKDILAALTESRSPSYLMRQMFDMQQGFRKGTWTDLMKPVVANLATEDMMNIVAYTASQMP
jgi:cytochrome c553